MTRAQIARRRLYSQRLWGRRLESPEAVVRWLGAVQSQEFALAKWSVGQRMKRATDAQIDQAFTEGTILRTHVLRPTWHFVLPEDIRWMLELTAPRVHARNRLSNERLELSGRLLSRADRLFVRALEDGRHLTRAELGAFLERAGITATGVRLAHLVMHAELEGLICSGGPRGRRQTYALLDERAPPAKPVNREDALAELARRFFLARGPATVNDFGRWSSLPVADARIGVQMVASELENEMVDGRMYWFGERAAGPTPHTPIVDLVQAFDESLVAYAESKDVVLGPLVGEVVPSGRPLYLHGVLLNGQLVGQWRPVRGKDSMLVEARLHRKLTRTERDAMNEAATHLSRFLKTPVIVRVA